MSYENLLKEADSLGIYVSEERMNSKIKGLYSDSVIWLNKHLSTNNERYTVLAEEIGHHYTTTGDILDQKQLQNVKQENRARNWAYEHTIPITKIIEAHHEHITNKFELAEYLGVTETFLESALISYANRYGDHVKVNRYTVSFSPLGVVEWFDE